MSAVDDILSQIPLGQLAAQLGTDEQTAEAATRSALPALLGGLQANAQDPDRAASLTEALGQHSPSLIEGGVDLNQVDANQGDSIVSHIFGGNRDAVANEVGAGGPGGGMVQKLMPILAPIVMSYLAKQMTGGGGGQGGLGGVLGSVLGGGAGGGLGGLAGGLGGPNAGGGGLGDMLGGLLGQGRR